MTDIDFSARQRFTELNQLKLGLELGCYHCEILGWGFLGERWWRNYLHVHSFYEVCCAFDGEGLFRINDIDYAVRAGDVFVAKPAEPHEIISSESAPLGIYFWSYTLTRARPTPGAAPDLDIDTLLDDFTASHCWVSARTTSMISTLTLLTEEIVACAPGYRRMVDGLAAKLIIDTARAVAPPPIALDVDTPNQSFAPEQMIRQITRYLNDNFSRPLTIRDVAAQVHLSERHISRIFHNATGTTIKDHVQHLRIETAARSLINTRDPIKEIGTAVGFPDVQHFTTIFRRHTGLTPAAFRRQGGTRFVDPALPGHVQPGRE